MEPLQIYPIEQEQIDQPVSLQGINDINERMQFQNTQIREIKKLRKETIIQIILMKLDLLILLIAYNLMNNKCYETQIKELFIITIVVNIIVIQLDKQQFSKQLNYINYYQQYILIYQKYKIMDQIIDYNILNFHILIQKNQLKLLHNIIFVINYLDLLQLEITLFIVMQIIIYNNINGQCKFGNNDTNFTWGILIMFLIIKYINIGIPIFLYIIFLLLKCCLQCFQYRYNNNQQQNNGLNQIQINNLQINIVNNKNINNDNECIICLQEFQIGEEYINLSCHQQHSYHKQCIIDWLKTRKECPKCRQIVKI